MDGYKLDSRPPETHEFDFGMESLKQKIQLSESQTGIKTATLAKPVRGDLVTMTINLKFGNLSSLLNQDSAAAMASAMLLRGTTRYTRQQIDDEFVRLGASPSFSLGTTGGRVSLVAKKETFMQAVDLVLHVLKEPGFPEHEFEELRSASLKSLDGRIKDKSAQASSAWERYGNPYSKDDFRYEQTLEETRRERAAVTVAQVRDFHARFYGGQHAQVALLGPIDNLAEFRTVVERELANWRAKVEWKRVPYPLTKSPPARLTFDTPDKANVSVRGYQEIALSSLGEEKAFFALDLAVKMFGGGSGSRLWNRLRETDGMSYSVGANLSASSYERNGKVNFYAEMAPQNLAKAEAAIMQEITDSLREGFTQAELDKYKQQFLFERKRGRSGDSYALNIMRSKMEFGLPWERSAENDRLISSLTLDEVNEAWRQYLQPADIVWGVFGDQSKFQ
jgi:zinc protease